jgi:hypothetical protein
MIDGSMIRLHTGGTMKKSKRVVKLAEATRSRVDVGFIEKSSLPKDKAIRVAALLADVSERAARRQWRKANSPT